MGNDHTGWHSRGYLPHFDRPGLVQSLTFRLADAVPPELVDRWKRELEWHARLGGDDPRSIELRRRVARYEDLGHGACWLGRPEIAELVEKAMLLFESERYRLLAWCVMPNHVHAMAETRDGWPLDRVVHSWKSFTAKKANALLGRRGGFWMPDYYDRFIRSATHYRAAIAYIERNPVEAGLVRRADEWLYSSAHRRRSGDA